MSYNYQTIPTVHATAIPEKYSDRNYDRRQTKTKKEETFTNSLYNETIDVQVEKGETQPAAFRDAFFGLLFWTNIVIVAVLSLMFLTGRIEVDYDGTVGSIHSSGKSTGSRFLMTSNNEESTVMSLSSMSICIGALSPLIIAPTFAIGLFTCLANNASRIIKFSIYSTIVINILFTVILLVSGSIGPAFFTGISAGITYMYSRAIWHRIPLAAANLKAAITAIQAQLGVAFLGLSSIPLYAVWWVVWIYFFISSLNTPFMISQIESTKIVHASGYKGDDDYVGTLEESRSAMWYFVVFLMLLSFYWTNQVIKNTVQTTTAGAIGTFWFVPSEAVGCCSSALTSSMFRSLTYSFGSICLGSLLVAIIQALRVMVQQAEDNARNNRDGGGALILCIAQCLLSMLESIAEYFNRWAFIYVGLYGYSYIEAGKNVVTLFRERGWTSIISDNLTSRALGVMAFAVGICTGLLSALLVSLSLTSSDANGAILGSLFWGIFAGFLLASIIFGVVNSATDTIIVLFAEAPNEFQQNHPRLALEMKRTWSEAYPDVFTPVTPTIVV